MFHIHLPFILFSILSSLILCLDGAECSAGDADQAQAEAAPRLQQGEEDVHALLSSHRGETYTLSQPKRIIHCPKKDLNLCIKMHMQWYSVCTVVVFIHVVQ